ncbi:MAG: hypothetical protein HUU20_02880 [Pirellulales bacterium]|nr:hypothetical protein [Pirellulales bacterium]
MISRFVPVLTWLLAFAACCSAGGRLTATDAEGPAAEFRRVFTPADRLEEMPRDHARYVPMKADDFERLLAAGSPSEDGGPARRACIASAQYVARLAPEGVIQGDATLNIVHQAPGHVMLPLEPCTMAISEAAWAEQPPRPAKIGLGPEGGLEVLVERAEVLRFRWSLRGSRDPSGVLLFPLELPVSPSRCLLIDLPVGLEPSVKPGIVLRESATGTDPVRWRIQLGGHPRADLRLLAEQETDERCGLILARHFLVYDLSLRGIELSAEVRLDVHHEPVRDLTLALDRGLELVAARYGESAVAWSVLTRPAEGKGSRVLLELPEPVQGAARVVKLRAVGAVVRDRRWRLPGLRVEGTSWQEGNATVAVRAPLTFQQLTPIRGRQSKTGVLSSPRPGETVDVQYFGEDAGIDVAVARAKSPVRAAAGTAVELGSGEITGKVVVELSVADGEVFQLEADVGRQWLIDSVRSDPPEALGDGWTVRRESAGAKKLAVRFDQALSPDRPIRLIVSSRRLNSPVGRPLGIQDLAPTRLVDVAYQRNLISLRTVEPYRLNLEGAERLARIDPGSLKAAEQRLFVQPPREVLFENNADAARLKVSLVTPKPSYSAASAVDAVVTDASLMESYRFRITPADAQVDRLLVHFSCPRQLPPRWNIEGSTEEHYSARRLSAEEQAAAGLDAGGETWEIVLDKPRAGVFEIGASRFSEMAGSQPVSLAGLPQADQQQGILVIRSLGTQIRARSASLDPLPVPVEPDDRLNNARAAYFYDPAADTADSSEPAVTVAVAASPLPAAWIWNSRLESRRQINGVARHTAILHVENAGKQELMLQLPRTAALDQVISVSADGASATWRRDTTAGAARILVVLPPGRRYPLLTVQFATQGDGAKALGWVRPPHLTADVPIFSQEWTVWLPPGYEIADSRNVRLDRPRARPTWSQRLMGPLGRPAGHAPFVLTDPEHWTRLLPRNVQFALSHWLPAMRPGVANRAGLESLAAELPTSPRPPAGPWIALPDADNDPRESLGWTVQAMGILPGGDSRILVVPADSYRAAIWLMMLTVLALVWWIAAGRPAVVLAMLGVAGATALVLPDVYVPAASGAVLGLLACLGFFLLKRWNGHAASTSELHRTEGSTTGRAQPRPTGSVLIAVAAVGLAGAAQGQEPAAPAKAPSRVVHHVLVPVDAQEKPTGGSYYVPDVLYQELRRRSDRLEKGPHGWLLRNAAYRGAVARQSGPEQFVVPELRAVFELEVLERATTVRIPLARDGLNLLPEGATLDGRPVQPDWQNDDRALAVEIGEPGVYRLELAVRPLVRSLGGHKGISLQIPRLATSRLELDLPSNAPLIEVPTARGSVTRLQQPDRVLAELGAADRLEIRWPDAAGPGGTGPDMDVEQLLWLKIHPGSVVLAARWKVKVIEGVVRRLRVAADPRLRPLPPREAENPLGQVQTVPGRPQTIQIDLAVPVKDQVVVELDFLLTGASGIGNVRLPQLELEQAHVVKRWMAVSVDPALVYEPQASVALEPVAPPEFGVAWGKAESQPVLAYNLLSAQPDWSLATRPDEPHVLVDQALALNFAPGSARVRFDAQLGISGYGFQYRLSAPKELQVEEVSVREQSAQRAARWSRDEDGSVVVFLSGPAAEKQNLRLTGSLPMPSSGNAPLPHLRVLGAEMRSCEIQVYRDPSVLVDVVKSNGLVDVELPIAAEDKTDFGRLVKWFTVADCSQEATAELAISPNQPQVTADQTISLRSEAGSWETDVEYRIAVRRGVVDEFRLRVPAQWAGPYRVEPNAAVATVGSSESQYRELVVRPRLAVHGEYRLRISAPLTSADGQRVGVPGIRLLDARLAKSIVVLPASVEGSPVSWETRGLTPAPVPDGTERRPSAGPLVAFKAEGESFQAILNPTQTTGRSTAVLLADVFVAWQANGTYRALGILDVDPAGELHLPLTLPEGSELIQLRVGGVPIVPEAGRDSSWQFRLASPTIPQQVEVLYSGKASEAPPGGSLRLHAPVLGRVPAGPILWTIQGPADYALGQVQGGDAMVAAQLDFLRLKSAVSVLDRFSKTGIRKVEGRRSWDAVWLAGGMACRDRLRSGENTHARQPRSEERDAQVRLLSDQLDAFAGRSGESAAGLRPSALDSLHSWLGAVPASETTACYVSPPGSDSLSIGYQPVEPRGVWQRLALVAACVVLVPLSLATRVRRTAARILCRWPAAIGVLVGLAWWAWLEPSALGWVIVLLTLALAAIPGWKRRRSVPSIVPLD